MKKQELIKIIETVVRQEVKKQMNEIFIKEENSSSLTELVSKPLTEKEFKEPIRKQYKTKPKKKVHYTSNETLNNILNETAGGVPQGEGGAPQVGGYEEYPTLGDGTFDSSKMKDVIGKSYGYLMNDNVSVDGQTPDFLTKDYRKLMKAVDKKQGVNNGIK